MRQITRTLIFLFLSLLIAPEIKAQTVISIGTADKDVISVIIETPSGSLDNPTQDPAVWLVNGNQPEQVGRYSVVWDEEKRYWGKDPEWVLTMRHHMYLKLSEPLINGNLYTIVTPGAGTHEFTFNENHSRCEAIHVNQVGYFGGSTIRYANFAIYKGDLGTRKLSQLPSYKVLNEQGNEMISGTLSYWGDDTGRDFETGEQVYRINLAGLPEGGPYTISVEGYGCSYPFGIGPEYVNQATNVHIRGLYHQRCGIALEEPYTEYTRGACHTTVLVTDTDPEEGWITDTGPEMSFSGGYHDAGDYDQRYHHILIPMWLLSFYEMYPTGFNDNEFNLPESGNGIPDFLDETLYSLKVWETLQEEDGAIRAGIESDGHPDFGNVTAETDVRIYRTYKRYGITTALGCGQFAQASRLVRNFDSNRADELLSRSLAAWNYLEEHSDDPDMESAVIESLMYASLQLYLATEDQAYHELFKQYAEQSLDEGNYDPYYIPDIINTEFNTPYFMSYMITDQPADETIIARFKQELLKPESDAILNALNTKPYPIGHNREVYAWGTTTGQGRNAFVLISMYRLTNESKYVDAVSQLSDYNMGLNPLGRSYVTGLGAKPPHNICHGDSYFTKMEGKGLVPGLVLYGPESAARTDIARQIIWGNVYPEWKTLPVQKRFSDGWSLIGATEFTVQETMVKNVCMFAFLSSQGGGGKIAPPETPEDLEALAFSPYQVNLSWSDKAINESSIRIERQTALSGDFVLITSLPSNSTQYKDINLEPSTTYSYRIRTVNGNGSSEYSEETTATTPAIDSPPEKPDNLSAKSLSVSEIELQWIDMSFTEDGYSLERKGGEQEEYTEIAVLDSDKMLYNDTGLQEDSEYYYRIRAFNSQGYSEYSEEVFTQTQEIAASLKISLDGKPAAFDQLNAYGQDVNGGYEFHDNGESLFLYGNSWKRGDLRYFITPQTILEFEFKSTDESEIHGIGFDTDNTVDEEKTFMIYGYQTWGITDYNTYSGVEWKQYSIPVGKYYTGFMKYLFFCNDGDDYAGKGYFRNIKIYNGQPPESITGLEGHATSSSQTELSWTDNSDDEQGFMIERKESMTDSYSVVGITDADITHFTDTCLSASVLYYYRVSSYNSAGQSAASEITVITPSSSEGDEYGSDSNTIVLWHYSDATDQSGNDFHPTISGNAEFSDENLGWMTSPSGLSLKIMDVEDNASASIPASLLWPGGKQTTLEYWIYPLAWKTYGIANYTLIGLDQYWDSYFKTDQGKWDKEPYLRCNNKQINQPASIPLNQWTHIALVYDGNYFSYYMNKELVLGPVINTTSSRTDNILLTSGNFEGFIDELRVSDVARCFGGGSLPSAPENPDTVSVGINYIELSWADSSENEIGFIIERKLSEELSFTPIAIVDCNDSLYSDQDLLSATSYIYRICAFNNAGNSEYSDEIEVQTDNSEPIPAAPSDLLATVISGSQINLNWTDNADNETWFKIERKTSEDPTFYQIGTSAAGTSGFINTGLSASTQYIYRVSAYNLSGNSEYSNEITARTPMDYPENLSATQISGYKIELNWQYREGKEEGFILERKTSDGASYSEIADIEPEARNYIDEDIIPDEHYYYRIYAYNSTENSAFSNEAGITTVSSDPGQSLDECFSIMAWPNPFNNATGIYYSLQQQAHVQIRIIDVSGRLVATLADKETSPGKHYLFWDRNNSAGENGDGGIYFCVALVEGTGFSFTQSIKLFLLN